MADQRNITETVRQIVEHARLADASSLNGMPELGTAKKLQFSREEFYAMERALRTEKVLTVAELHQIIAETKRREDEIAKAAELDGSLLIGGIYLFDQEAPLDRGERAEAVLNYENLSDGELEPDLKIGDDLDSGEVSRASSRSMSIPADNSGQPAAEDSRPPTAEPLGDIAGNAVKVEDDENASSNGELDDSEPGEAEVVDNTDPGLERDRKAYAAWNFPPTRPVGSSVIPAPALLPADRVSLLTFLSPMWTTKASSAPTQLSTPDGRAEINAYVRGRQCFLPELGKFVTASHMTKQEGDCYYIHAPNSPPFTLRGTILSQLYLNRKVPLEFPKLMLVVTDAGIYPLERLFVRRYTNLEMLSTIPSARKPRGPPVVPEFNPAVPPPLIPSRTGHGGTGATRTGAPLVRTRLVAGPTGKLENAQPEPQWTTVVSRRAKPPARPMPSAVAIVRPTPAEENVDDAPSTSASAQRPPRIIYVQQGGKRSLPHDHAQCDHCGHILKLARH